MIEIFKEGLWAAKEATAEKSKRGGWTVYIKGQNRRILIGYGLRFMFSYRPLMEMILPPASEMVGAGDVPVPEDTTRERLAHVNLWTACFLEMLKEQGLHEDGVLKLVAYISVTPLEQMHEEVRELLEKVPQTTKKQYYFLFERIDDKQWVDKLLERSRLDRAEIKKAFSGRQIPIIFMQNKGGEEAELAQMCLWAMRQGKKLNEIEQFLYDFVSETITTFIKKKRTSEQKRESYSTLEEGHYKSKTRETEDFITTGDIVSDTYLHILKHWETPFSQGSFYSYIYRCAAGFYSKELGKENRVWWRGDNTGFAIERKTCQKWLKASKPLGFATPVMLNSEAVWHHGQDYYTVYQAAEEIGCTEDWLYYQLRKGKLVSCPQTKMVTEQITIIKRNDIDLTYKAVKEAEELFYLSVLRKADFTQLVATRRNTGRRAAQRWVKRRVDQGRGFKEIVSEAGITKKELNVLLLAGT